MLRRSARHELRQNQPLIARFRAAADRVAHPIEQQFRRDFHVRSIKHRPGPHELQKRILAATALARSISCARAMFTPSRASYRDTRLNGKTVVGIVDRNR